MPIMASHGRSDARSTARLLAGAALKCIDYPAGAHAYEVPLNNVYRLLESFRRNTLFGLEPPSERRPSYARGKLTLRPPSPQHVREVREALERAKDAAFADQPRDEAIRTVENVLRLLAYPPKHAPGPTQADLQRAAVFFKEFGKSLR